MIARSVVLVGVVSVSACSRGSRPDNAPPAPAPAPAAAPASAQPSTESRVPTGVVGRAERFRTGDAGALRRFRLDVPLPSDSGECNRERLPGGDEIVLMYYPSRANAVAVSSVVLAENGRFLRFSDRRGGVQVPGVPGGTRAQQDSAFAAFLAGVRRTTILLDYRTDRAFLMNEGGGRPDERLTVPLHYVARDRRFDAPDARAHDIVARCR